MPRWAWDFGIHLTEEGCGSPAGPFQEVGRGRWPTISNLKLAMFRPYFQRAPTRQDWSGGRSLLTTTIMRSKPLTRGRMSNSLDRRHGKSKRRISKRSSQESPAAAHFHSQHINPGLSLAPQMRLMTWPIIAYLSPSVKSSVYYVRRSWHGCWEGCTWLGSKFISRQVRVAFLYHGRLS